MRRWLSGLFLAGALTAQATQARQLCEMIMVPDTGDILLETGDCDSRVTPASTFKVALALMGFDSGALVDAHTPVLPYQPDYVDWGGDAWRQETDPTHWMTYSVVWYSQLIAQELGEKTLHDYATAFEYGNADFSGDPGKNNGLERAWISSSLMISPREQAEFLSRMLMGRLPVSDSALTHTIDVIATHDLPGGWVVHGKTGGAYPRLADDSLDFERGWGWFVGWAERDDARVVFVRLDQDESRQEESAGLRARAAFLRDFPDLMTGIAQ
ncbi:class D beta-lactamase [Sedimentitalea sp. XS_ASV28]|uniref:class D beta-lactamase n=1 Tax=Sedimentitalea sp. XS_ASV28 TaxID=3241296 RepID=UPI003514581D